MAKSELPEIMIITGMSGAGKSHALEVFEDLGYNCVDNMPPSLITKFVEICNGPGVNFNRLCIVVDCRTGELFESIYTELKSLRTMGFYYRVLFLEASDEVIKRRYKETRRRHPLERLNNGDISKAISMERKMLAHAREDADIVIDTSLSTSRKLKEMIYKKFSTTDYAMNITVMSFGFKFGPQTDADMLFDVRCLPNPYYVEDMSSLTGLDQKVSEYVFQWDESQGYFRKIMDALTFALPLFSNEGRSNLTIAFGCTGGRHRSVSFAQRAAEEIQKAGYRVTVIHRDIEKS